MNRLGLLTCAALAAAVTVAARPAAAQSVGNPQTPNLEQTFNDAFFLNNRGFFYETGWAGQAQAFFNLKVGRYSNGYYTGGPRALGGSEMGIAADGEAVSRLTYNVINNQGESTPAIYVIEPPNPFNTSIMDPECRAVNALCTQGLQVQSPPPMAMPEFQPAPAPFVPPPPVIRGRG